MIERRAQVRLEMSNEIYGRGGQGVSRQGGDKPRPYNIRNTGANRSIVPALHAHALRTHTLLTHALLTPSPHDLPQVGLIRFLYSLFRFLLPPPLPDQNQTARTMNSG